MLTAADDIDDLLPELVVLRRDLHAHPELAFEERRTAGVVAAALRLLGLEVHEGLAGTGVIGTLRNGRGTRAVGLRADIDALPMAEQSRLGTRAAMPACTTVAATMVTPRCCSVLLASWRARAASTASCTSSSSRPRRGAAARA